MGPSAVLIVCYATAAVTSTPLDQHLFGNTPGATLRLFNATVGMTLSEWKALPSPPGLPAQVTAECEPGGGSSVVKPSAGPVQVTPNTLICSYGTRYGKIWLQQSLPINRRYLADNIKYAFSNERLIGIQFLTSIDAFSDVVALIKAAYGPPTEKIRDFAPRYDGMRLPRVRMNWQLKGGTIYLVDPAARPDDLAVEISARDAGGSSLIQTTVRPVSAKRSDERR